MTASPKLGTAQLARLSRIEGQLRGVRGMIVSGRYCLDISAQIDAVIGALRRVRLELVIERVREREWEARRRGDPTLLRQCLTDLTAQSAVSERPSRMTIRETGTGPDTTASHKRPGPVIRIERRSLT